MNSSKPGRLAARSGKRRRGVVFAEFAIVLPIVFLVVVWMILFAWIYFIEHTMLLAAREAARAMAVQNATAAQAQQEARNYLGFYGFDGTSFNVTVEKTPTSAPTDVRVTITLPASRCFVSTTWALAGKSLATRAEMKMEAN